MAEAQNTPPGPGVDASGQAVKDPTENVLDVVRAEARRQDDLRALEAKYVEKLAELRAEHAKELRIAEKGRIDAIRDVDVGNVAAAAAVSAVQATTLVGQVATTAEASRVALGAALDPIQKDVAELRRVQYQQQGERAQATETKTDTQTTRSNAGMWVGLAVAVLALLATVVLGVAGIVITLLLTSA